MIIKRKDTSIAAKNANTLKREENHAFVLYHWVSEELIWAKLDVKVAIAKDALFKIILVEEKILNINHPIDTKIEKVMMIEEKSFNQRMDAAENV